MNFRKIAVVALTALAMLAVSTPAYSLDETKYGCVPMVTGKENCDGTTPNYVKTFDIKAALVCKTLQGLGTVRLWLFRGETLIDSTLITNKLLGTDTCFILPPSKGYYRITSDNNTICLFSKLESPNDCLWSANDHRFFVTWDAPTIHILPMTK
jgi:hypothetical protein